MSLFSDSVEQIDPKWKDCKIKIQLFVSKKSYSFTWIVTYPFEIAKRIYNTFLLVWKGELREPLSYCCHPDEWMGEFKTFFMTWHVTSHQKIMRKILAEARHNPEQGHLRVGRSTQEFQQIFFDIFPNASQDDCLLFCHDSLVKGLRKPILETIGHQYVPQMAQDLDAVVEEIGGSIKAGEEINITDFTMLFTTTVISRLVLGHPGPMKVYKEISAAVACVNRYALRRAYHIRPNEEEKQQYKTSTETLREAIKKAEGPFVDKLEGFSKEQIQCTLLVMFIAGSETTASLLSYLIWELGKHPHIQQEIFDEITVKRKDYEGFYALSRELDSMLKLFREGIRLYTPAYVIGREAATDFELIVEDKKGQIVFSKIIRKGEGVLCLPTFAGRDASSYENPDTFDPSRYKEKFNRPEWLPFGSGTHSCPGQTLARAEAKAFLTWLILNYEITSSPDSLSLQGFATLKTKETISATFTSRI